MYLEADMHVHTIGSGHAYSTINENVEAARRKGLKMIAITDHGPALPGGPDISFFGYLQIIPYRQNGIEILKGVEANILDTKGGVDLPERYLEKLDIVLAGFHPPCYTNISAVQNTKAMINTIKNPLVDVIVHPGNPVFPVDIPEIVAAAKEFNTILEINNSSLTGDVRKGSRDNCRIFAKLIAEEGLPVLVGSDAHYIDRVGEFEAALELIEEAGIKEEKILNTSVKKVKSFLRAKGKL